MIRRSPDAVALVVVHVEAATALLAEPARGDEVPQQRRRAVLVVADLAVQDLGDGEHRVEADEVAQLERPHRVVEAELRAGIDVLRRADALLEARSTPRKASG